MLRHGQLCASSRYKLIDYDEKVEPGDISDALVITVLGTVPENNGIILANAKSL